MGRQRNLGAHKETRLNRPWCRPENVKILLLVRGSGQQDFEGLLCSQRIWGLWPIWYQAQGPCRRGRSARGRMKGIQTTKWYYRGRPSLWQAKIMGKKSATLPKAIHSRIAKRDSKPYGLAIGEWWRNNPKKCSHLCIKYPQLTPWPNWCGCDPWTGRWGPQQPTERQKEWLMGRALEDRHGWLSVGGGWMEERNI